MTLTEAKKLSKSFKGNVTKYPKKNHERLIKVQSDGTRVLLVNDSGKLKVEKRPVPGVYTSFYHA